MALKRCMNKKCNKLKYTTEFWKCEHNNDGLASYCKTCSNALKRGAYFRVQNDLKGGKALAQITTRIPKKLLDQIREEAHKKEISLSSLIGNILVEVYNEVL